MILMAAAFVLAVLWSPLIVGAYRAAGGTEAGERRAWTLALAGALVILMSPLLLLFF